MSKSSFKKFNDQKIRTNKEIQVVNEKNIEHETEDKLRHSNSNVNKKIVIPTLSFVNLKKRGLKNKRELIEEKSVTSLSTAINAYKKDSDYDKTDNMNDDNNFNNWEDWSDVWTKSSLKKKKINFDINKSFFNDKSSTNNLPNYVNPCFKDQIEFSEFLNIAVHIVNEEDEKKLKKSNKLNFPDKKAFRIVKSNRYKAFDRLANHLSVKNSNKLMFFDRLIDGIYNIKFSISRLIIKKNVILFENNFSPKSLKKEICQVNTDDEYNIFENRMMEEYSKIWHRD